MKRLHGAMAVATLLAFSLGARTVYTQQQGGRGRQGGPPTYRLWWAAKAKPGQYGTNKPHIKLADLKARHKGQANWMEVVVNDENWHAEYNQGAPGFKIATRMHPDTREFFAVIGRPDALHAGRASPSRSWRHAHIGHQHPEKDRVFRRRSSAMRPRSGWTRTSRTTRRSIRWTARSRRRTQVSP